MGEAVPRGRSPYESWRRSDDAVQRAKAAVRNSEARLEDHFDGAVKVIEGGRWGRQTLSCTPGDQQNVLAGVGALGGAR